MSRRSSMNFAARRRVMACRLGSMPACAQHTSRKLNARLSSALVRPSMCRLGERPHVVGPNWSFTASYPQKLPCPSLTVWIVIIHRSYRRFPGLANVAAKQPISIISKHSSIQLVSIEPPARGRIFRSPRPRKGSLTELLRAPSICLRTSGLGIFFAIWPVLLAAKRHT